MRNLSHGVDSPIAEVGREDHITVKVEVTMDVEADVGMEAATINDEVASRADFTITEGIKTVEVTTTRDWYNECTVESTAGPAATTCARV